MNESEKRGKGIGDKIIVLWFIIAFLAIVLSYSLKSTWLSVATFGHLFFGMGIMALVKDIKIKKNVGMSGSLFVRFASSDTKQKLISLLEDKSVYLILIVFILAGILLMYRAYIQAFIIPKKYSYSIMATCIEHKSTFSEGDGMSRSKTLYCPVLFYNFNGVEYTACNNVYGNRVKHKIGQQYSINIDPNEHGKYLEVKENMVISVILFIIGLLVIGAASYFALQIF